jgi:hypothetical protein
MVFESFFAFEKSLAIGFYPNKDSAVLKEFTALFSVKIRQLAIFS